ncbi:MAG: nitrilase-related carbon-nitrogen hydrolase, partial [Gammaproteobacteria bacterium]
MTLKVALAQVNPVVGDVAGNVARILAEAARARDELGADLVLFPELILCGYPPEDLLFHGNMRRSVASALEQLCEQVQGISVLVGYPEYEAERIHNSAALIADGRIAANYRKQILPNYGVFDEQRYFTAGDQACVLEIAGIRCGLTICEDIWRPGPAKAARDAGAELLLVINGSPYDTTSQQRREEAIRARVSETGLPLVYCNMVGGQDELVFDGGSLVVDKTGAVIQRAPAFEEALLPVVVQATATGAVPEPGESSPLLETEASVYQALVLGVRDYVDKH